MHTCLLCLNFPMSMLFQDEVRLRLFLDSIGFSDLNAKKIKKWMPEDRRQFEIIQDRYRLSATDEIKFNPLTLFSKSIFSLCDTLSVL